jgi:hypothetical protein
MYLVRKHSEFVRSFLTSDTPRAMRLAAAAVALFLGGIGLAFLCAGAPAMNGRPADVPLSLDCAWRILHGQVPHRDFFCYLGAFPYYVTWLGMKLSSPSIAAIVYGNVVLMGFVGCVALWLLRRRTSGFYAFLFTVFYGLLVVAPRPLGDPHDFIDFAMLYNRFGEAFLGLFCLWLFISPRTNSQRFLFDFIDSIIAGLCLAVLWFTKLNYFWMATALSGFALVFRFVKLREAIFAGGAALAFLALVLALTGIPLRGMWGDFHIVVAGQSLHNRLSALAVQGVKYFLLLPILLLGPWEISTACKDEVSNRPRASGLWLLPLAALGCALFLLSTNCQVGDMPLLIVPALFVAEMIRRRPPEPLNDPFFSTARNLGALAYLFFFLLPILGTDLKATRNGIWSALQKKYLTTDTLRSTNLNDFRFAWNGTRLLYSEDYMAELDEGIQLLRRHSDPAMRLAVLRFSNPYHLALGLPPSTGGFICLAPALISPGSHPSLPRVLGNATHLLTNHNCDELKELYGAQWDALNLEIVERTQNFTLFKLPVPSVAEFKH